MLRPEAIDASSPCHPPHNARPRTDDSSIYPVEPRLEQDISRRFFLGAALGIAAGLATAHTASMPRAPMSSSWPSVVRE